jgi:hypothetical protein
MIITENSPEVVILKRVWNYEDGRIEGLAEGLKRLARSAILPAVQTFQGELILKYQEFLTRVPSGRHSFAHGSEMISKIVHWVSVARIAGSQIEEVPIIPAPNQMSFATPSKVLVPVQWEIYLKPQYRRGAHFPHFVLGEMTEQNERKFDLAPLGHHLFRMRRGDLDWATKIEIAIGNESVGTWLRERKSAQTFNMLMRR